MSDPTRDDVLGYSTRPTTRRDLSRHPQLANQVRCASGYTHAPGGRLVWRAAPARGRVDVPAPAPLASLIPATPIELDAQARTLRWYGRTATLSPSEFLLVSRLLAADGDTVLHDEMRAAGSGIGPFSAEIIRNTVSLLRHGLGLVILAVPHKGYRLQLPKE